MPLFNKRAYIRRAVDSVLGQTFQEFELIVVDDGSTDGGPDGLGDIKDTRLRIVRQVNAGVGAARNKGMAEGIGHWIAFLDADDAWLPEHLDELAQLAAQFPKAGLLSTTCIEGVGPRLHALPEQPRSPRRREVDYFLEASRRIGIVNSTSAAIRQAIVIDVGGFSHNRAGEDLEYWARVALRYPIALSEKVTCVYYRDTRGVMRSVAGSAEPDEGPVRSLREISPSVAMLCDTAEKDPRVWENPSIRSYVNARLRNAVRGALFRDQVAQAKNLGPLFLKPFDLPTKTTAGILALPHTIIIRLLDAYRVLRRMSH